MNVGRQVRMTRLRQVGRRAVLAGLALPFISAAPDRGLLRIGLTPVLLDNDAALLDALAGYLGHRTGYRIDLQRRRTYQEISALLLSGQVDAAWICGYPYIQARERLSLVAVPVWNGRPLYQSYVIAGADGPQTLAGLRGTVHAFSDPDSNSGWLCTAHRLALIGETPSAYFSRFFFTYGHRNVIRAVSAGLANSGSVDGYVFEILSRREPGLTAGLAVIERSAWHGFPPIACPAEAAASDAVQALTEALIGMAGTEDGVRVLSMLGLDGFERASPDLFASIAAMVPATRAAP